MAFFTLHFSYHAFLLRLQDSSLNDTLAWSRKTAPSFTQGYLWACCVANAYFSFLFIWSWGSEWRQTVDYTACGEVLQGRESSVKSAGRRGMRISNRGSDTERFFSDYKMSTLQQDLRNLRRNRATWSSYMKRKGASHAQWSRSANAGDMTRSLGREDSLEKEMATHPSILAGKNPTDRGAWRACSPWGRKESNMT